MRTQSHTGHICLTFHYCVFSNVYSNCLPDRMQSHTGCICMVFLHCAILNGPSNALLVWMHSHIGCISLAFLHCAFSNVPWKCLPEKRQSHIGCICLTCTGYGAPDEIRGTVSGTVPLMKPVSRSGSCSKITPRTGAPGPKRWDFLCNENIGCCAQTNGLSPECFSLCLVRITSCVEE